MLKILPALALILFSHPVWSAEKTPDLVAVKGGSPVQMFEEGIQAIGGMGRFVKKGQTVLVKPNIGWNKAPSAGATTNPELVGVIVKKAYEAGAKEVWVFDHTCDGEKASYRNSGIQEAVEKNKGMMFTGDDEKDYVDTDLPKAKLLKKSKVHKRYLNADVVINVPVLKHHMGSRMTASLKNLMGVVWDRREWHRMGLHECIADFATLRKVDLTVIDAYTVMMAHGPRGISMDDVEQMKMQILSTDMVLADTAASKILQAEAKGISHLGMSEKLGIGSTQLEKAEIRRINLAEAGGKKSN